MNTLQEKINQAITQLPLSSQKEVLDFVMFLRKSAQLESDNDYLSKNTEIKQAIVEGLNTPLSVCSKHLDW